MDRAVIHFVCVRPEHVKQPAPGMGTLTIFEGQWAYCHASALAEEHQWEPSSVKNLEELMRSTHRPLEHPQPPRRSEEPTS